MYLVNVSCSISRGPVSLWLYLYMNDAQVDSLLLGNWRENVSYDQNLHDFLPYVFFINTNKTMKIW